MHSYVYINVDPTNYKILARVPLENFKVVYVIRCLRVNNESLRLRRFMKKLSVLPIFCKVCFEYGGMWIIAIFSLKKYFNALLNKMKYKFQNCQFLFNSDDDDANL